MDSEVISVLLEKVDALSGRLADLDLKLQELSSNQAVQGEIQIESVKLFQLMRNDQKSGIEGLYQAIEAMLPEEGSTTPGNPDALRGVVEAFALRHSVELNVIKQTCNLALREMSGHRGGIRCVFLVHSIPMWDALADVYQAMMEDGRFDPVVISINSTPLGRGAFVGEDAVSRALGSQGIKHLRFNMDDSYEGLDILKALRPAVIFRQQQWDGCLPPAFRTPELTFARLCHVPYALNLLVSLGDRAVTEVSPFGFDQAYHRAAWRVFCETSITQSYYRSFDHSDPEKFIVSGYPKFDRLMKAKGEGAWPIKERKGRRFRVVWAPHYSLGTAGLGFGVFDQICDRMIRWARECPEIDFVLKPHPALLGQVLTGEGLDHFRKIWLGQPNCAIEEEQYGELFAASDLMISDGVSFLAEYHLFEKPLIFFDSGRHVAFNALGKLAEACAHRVRTFEEMKKAVLEYRNGKEWGFAAERRKLLDVLLPNRGHAASHILDSIAEGISASASSVNAIQAFRPSPENPGIRAATGTHA